MRNFIFIIFFISHSIYSYCQFEPNIISPNPESSSLLKFEQIPVNPYSGVADIKLPIYTLKAKTIEIPIFINYHSRGNRVSQIASRVGLGWALNYGGMITRQVRDAPDDHLGGYLTNILGIGNFYDQIFSNSNIRSALYSYGVNNTLDMVPDQFFYSYPAGSGKFIIDQIDDEVVLQKFKDEIITYGKDNNGYINKFEIRDTSGNIYTFGKSTQDMNEEIAISKSQTSEKYYFFNGNYYRDDNFIQDIFIDTWYLLEIKTKANELIQFEYESETSNYLERLYDNYPATGSGGSYPFPVSSDTPRLPFSVVEKKINHNKRIKSITYCDTEIRFNYYDEQRLDLSNSKALKSIKVFNKSNLIKSSNFQYSYTTSDFEDATNINSHPMILSNTQAKRRLFLNSVEFIGINSDENNDLDNETYSYSFRYNEQTLPSRMSNSVDRWGYFNGKQNGNYLVEVEGFPNKREVVPEYVNAGLLEEIHLPTGGVQKFEYEQNIGYSFIPLGNVNLAGGNQYIGDSIHNVTVSEFDHINEDVFINNLYRKTFEVPNYNVNSFSNKVDVQYNAWISPSNGCGTFRNANYTEECPFRISFVGPGGSGGYLPPGNGTISLFPGEHTITVMPRILNYDPTSINESFYVNFAIRFPPDYISNENNDDSDFKIHGPGKRIKKSIIKDNYNAYSTEYIYKDENGMDSGLIFGLSDYFYIMNDDINIIRPNRAGELVSSQHSNEIGYEYVQIVKSSLDSVNNDKIKSVYKFTMNPDYNLFWEWPFITANDSEWLRGKVLEQTDYRFENGNFIKISKTSNRYMYANSLNPASFNIPNFDVIDLTMDDVIIPESHLYRKDEKFFNFPLYHIKAYGMLDDNSVALMHSDNFPDDYDPNLNYMGFRIYNLTSGTMDLVENKITEFYDNGLEKVTTTKSEFDYERSYNPIAIKNFTSIGDSIISNFYYPKDLLDQGIQPTLMQRLINENRIGQPIKTEIYKNEFTATNQLSAKITKYQEFIEGSSNLLLPKEEYSIKGMGEVATYNAENKKISYDRYDSHGNLLQYTLENGIPVSIIWGYEGQYPIAKIEGVAYNQISSTLLNNVINKSNADTTNCTGNTGCNEAELRVRLQTLRNNLVNALVTTYTYDPLIGVTSITPPNGQTTYYQYDGFGRLKSVVDEAGNKVQDIQYNYRPTP